VPRSVTLNSGTGLDRSPHIRAWPWTRQNMLPVTARWARIGPANRKWLIHVPPGGLCLSAFVLIRNRRGDVLFGRPRVHSVWPEKGGVGLWRVREFVRSGVWVLPATHLLMDEDPSKAAGRIARTWGGIPHPSPNLVGVDSCRLPTSKKIGAGKNRYRVYHWALGFVYELQTRRHPRPFPGWSETRFVPLSELRTLRIGRGHRDFLRYLTEIPKE